MPGISPSKSISLQTFPGSLSHVSSQSKPYSDFQQRVAARMGPLMFWFSLTFLVCVSCLVVLWVDVPNLRTNAAAAFSSQQGSVGELSEMVAQEVDGGHFEDLVVFLMLVVWGIVIVESVYHWIARPWDLATRKYHWLGLLFCCCPALRMCARSPEMGERLWLQGWGWRKTNKRFRKRLERKFSVPMIVIALMIMPILIVEFFMKAQVAQYAWLRLLLHVGTGVIWFAFAFEFILMVSVAEKKLAYCKKHWIDLAIILLPIISFLRSMRLMRATRAAKLMRVPQITKMVRMYRLRGTAVKAIQALILLDTFQRIVSRDPQRTIDKLEVRLEEVEDEAKELKRKISRLRRQIRREAQDAVNAAGSAEVSPEQGSVPSEPITPPPDRQLVR